MELKHIAARSGRLSSFLREEMQMSAGLRNRLKWKEGLFVNGNPVHTDYAVQPGDVITVALDEPAPEYPATHLPTSATATSQRTPQPGGALSLSFGGCCGQRSASAAGSAQTSS